MDTSVIRGHLVPFYNQYAPALPERTPKNTPTCPSFRSMYPDVLTLRGSLPRPKTYLEFRMAGTCREFQGRLRVFDGATATLIRSIPPEEGPAGPMLPSCSEVPSAFRGLVPPPPPHLPSLVACLEVLGGRCPSEVIGPRLNLFSGTRRNGCCWKKAYIERVLY